MSAPSGIRASDDLRKDFPGDASARFLKVEIIDELEMRETDRVASVGTMIEDLDLVAQILVENEPCYVLCRTDDETSRGFKYMLFCFVPDYGKVRQKMLYASSRTALRQGLGADNFSEEIFGTEIDDFTAAGYERYLEHKNSENPLTEKEIKLKEEREYGVFEGGAGSSVAYVHGVQFPIDEAVLAALDQFAHGDVNYVQMSIDADKEEIILNTAGNHGVEEMEGFCPNNEPRYHLYRWQYNHEGTDHTVVIYCFSCPDGSEGTLASPIKLRMLYASSKSNVAFLFEERDIEVGLKLEICRGSEFSLEELMQERHPVLVERKAVKKPSGPGGSRRKPTRRR